MIKFCDEEHGGNEDLIIEQNEIERSAAPPKLHERKLVSNEEQLKLIAQVLLWLWKHRSKGKGLTLSPGGAVGDHLHCTQNHHCSLIPGWVPIMWYFGVDWISYCEPSSLVMSCNWRIVDV